MAAPPSAASNCVAAKPGKQGITLNQSRTMMKKDPFTTRLDRFALAAAGAPAGAKGLGNAARKAIDKPTDDNPYADREDRAALTISYCSTNLALTA